MAGNEVNKKSHFSAEKGGPRAINFFLGVHFPRGSLSAQKTFRPSNLKES